MGLFRRWVKKRGDAVQERYVAPFRPHLREGEEIIQVAVAREPYSDPRRMIYVGPTNQKRILWYYKDEPGSVVEIKLDWLYAAGMSPESMLVRIVEAPIMSSQLDLPGGGFTDTLWELIPNELSLQVMHAIEEQVGGREVMARLWKNLEEYVREQG